MTMAPVVLVLGVLYLAIISRGFRYLLFFGVFLGAVWFALMWRAAAM